MNAKEIAVYLRSKKDEKGWSSKHWSEVSGVPEATISRLLSAQNESPQFGSVAALVKAIDGSLDDLAGIEHPPVMIERERMILAADVKELVNVQREALDDLRAASRHERRVCRISWSITFFVLTAVVFFIVHDILNTDVGWIRTGV